jgi:AraC family L-rhamnose operon regulatory protein RhaS
MRVFAPIPISLPDYGVLFAESAHAAGFSMAERRDPYHKLIYLLDGKVAYWEGGRASSSIVETGAMLILPRETLHRLADVQPSTLLLLCLGDVFLQSDSELGQLWQALTRVPGHCLQLSRPTRQRLESMWRRSMVEKEHARVGGRVTVRALAAQTLVLLARLPPAGAGTSAASRVAAVTREIEETFFDQWDLDRAASRAGLSRRRFTDLFRAANKKTFWDFLNEQRLNHAARLLRTGENSVMGVMFSCGFNDLSHFYRLFRTRYGKPPAMWAKSRRVRAS